MQVQLPCQQTFYRMYDPEDRQRDACRPICTCVDSNVLRLVVKRQNIFSGVDIMVICHLVARLPISSYTPSSLKESESMTSTRTHKHMLLTGHNAL